MPIRPVYQATPAKDPVNRITTKSILNDTSTIFLPAQLHPALFRSFCSLLRPFHGPQHIGKLATSGYHITPIASGFVISFPPATYTNDPRSSLQVHESKPGQVTPSQWNTARFVLYHTRSRQGFAPTFALSNPFNLHFHSPNTS